MPGRLRKHCNLKVQKYNPPNPPLPRGRFLFVEKTASMPSGCWRRATSATTSRAVRITASARSSWRWPTPLSASRCGGPADALGPRAGNRGVLEPRLRDPDPVERAGLPHEHGTLSGVPEVRLASVWRDGAGRPAAAAAADGAGP